MYNSMNTINQALLWAMDTYASRPCFWVKPGNRFQATSYWRFRAVTLRLANHIQRQGIVPGDRVAIVAGKSVEWMVSAMATLFVGGVVVPIRHFLPPAQIHTRLRDADPKLIVAQNAAQYQHIADAGLGLPNVKSTLIIEPCRAEPDDQHKMLSLNTLLSDTRYAADEEQTIREFAATVPADATAAICYRSVDSREAYGAVFDQGQMLATLQSMAAWFTLADDDVAFTTPLPWSYFPNLSVSLHYFMCGVANALASGRETSFDELHQISPTVTLTTPNAFEYIYHQIIEDMSTMPDASREVFEWALTIGKEYRTAGGQVSEGLQRAYNQANLTFFSRIRGKLGGRLRRFYSVGAPPSKRGVDFAEAVGLLPLNVYSLTEAGGFPAGISPDTSRPGSCGQVAPGFEIRIASDGEILVRGQSVMREYWRHPVATQQVIDGEGWLRTGDLGYLDDDGFLYLTGNKKGWMVLSTGRKVTPELIESTLMRSPLVSQAVIFGDGRPYITAIIVPDLEALGKQFQAEDKTTENMTSESSPPEGDLKWYWPSEDDGEPVVTMAHGTVKCLLDRVVSDVNLGLDQWLHINQYALLDQAHSRIANELAELIKQGRQAVINRYALPVGAMYPEEPQVNTQPVTHLQVSPERMQDLLEKESILNAWMADAGIRFLFELAAAKQIDTPSMVHISDAAATIAQSESEEKPLSTALIVGDPGRIGRVLPLSQIQLLRHDHIRRMRRILITMAKIVDGLVLGFVVDKYGYVRGVHRLTGITSQETTNFLGPQFRRHAAISKLCDALVFFVPSGGRQVRVFADGQMVGRYANGDWSPDSLGVVERIIEKLADEKDYDAALISRILRCAFQMSEENMGAIFMLGEASMVLKRADTSEISSFAAILGVEIKHLTDQELINFAKQDGATIIDIEGQFRGCMVLLRPDANTQAEIGPGKGARHSSAAKMSAEADCLAITVSQDGPITIYDSGRRLLSL